LSGDGAITFSRPGKPDEWQMESLPNFWGKFDPMKTAVTHVDGQNTATVPVAEDRRFFHLKR
jgi:hypothetical protein